MIPLFSFFPKEILYMCTGGHVEGSSDNIVNVVYRGHQPEKPYIHQLGYGQKNCDVSILRNFVSQFKIDLWLGFQNISLGGEAEKASCSMWCHLKKKNHI